ncbi:MULTISPECIES: DUF2058 domain-containing protein [Alteromonadaceae]|uniref:DUF2058 domain-containing protein n=1 Tax=Alteromonadaceae TaxID=72275 RepID=UPI001C080C79|nr:MULTISPECIES: DUF2058 domain-containing protein [Aliiglaciecola]MBU2876220.1 DUF2058 domain-containing protein [Aliiglaciecola lipolytica]MDO6710436.1 DUF2058 domain-containing protein [Aliiglaciecola sp. 2_MG-2023]MDO6751699.1 DUF2058 domain-containing protein [Aliiglaciecola sp. 1_MG-2023]
MALSLQEQLLKAGLTDKNKVKQAKKEKHKQVKQQQKHKVVNKNESQIAAQKALREKQEKDRKLNQEAKALAESKAVLAQIKQLVELNKQPKDNGDIPCNFSHDNLIKRLYVNQQTRNRISQGKLAIVVLDGAYEIVPMPVADKIALRDKDAVVYRADAAEQAEAKSTSTAEEDEWYADYEIPDDLVW